MNQNVEVCPQTSSANTAIPVYLNADAGSARQWIEPIKAHRQLRLNEVPADQFADALKREVRQQTPRVVVCGGDGTIAMAASIVSDSSTELAVVPGGTLNHFCQRFNIPTVANDAIKLAIHGQSRPVAAGSVNGRLFINTSSIGAYVRFVRSRDYLQRKMGYLPASLIAGIHRLIRLRNHSITIGNMQLRTPLVFIGVGERELQFPFLGANKTDGREALHIIATQSSGILATLRMGINAALFGTDPMSRDDTLCSQIADSVHIGLKKRKNRLLVAIDGELEWMKAPLDYRHKPDAFRVVMP